MLVFASPSVFQTAPPQPRSNARWRRCTLGYAAQTACFGSLAYWTPLYLDKAKGIAGASSGTLFGAVSSNPWVYFAMAQVLILAALAMLRQAIGRCPDTAWHRDRGYRPLWRIAYHALFFTDLYGDFPDKAPPYPVIWLAFERDLKPLLPELLGIQETIRSLEARKLAIEEQIRAVHLRAVEDFDIEIGEAGLEGAIEEFAEREAGDLRVAAVGQPAVAARDLQECLWLQLRQLGQEGTPAEKIVTEHLRLLQNHQVPEIARKLGVSIDDLKDHIEIIKNLDPKPGSRYNPSQSQYVIPDVYVVKVEDQYVAVLNEDGLPQMRISPVYRRLLDKSAADNTDGVLPNDRDKKYQLRANLDFWWSFISMTLFQ